MGLGENGVAMRRKVVSSFARTCGERPFRGFEILAKVGNSNVAPFIQPLGRTTMPLRFIAENLNCKVDWLPETYDVLVTYPTPLESSSLPSTEGNFG
jgi:hypothetical protein